MIFRLPRRKEVQQRVHERKEDLALSVGERNASPLSSHLFLQQSLVSFYLLLPWWLEFYVSSSAFLL